MNSEVTRDVELPAPPDEVWEEVAESDRLGDWLDAEGELEVRPGGAGTFRLGGGAAQRAPAPAPGSPPRSSWSSARAGRAPFGSQTARSAEPWSARSSLAV